MKRQTMKYIKYLLIISLIFSFAMVSCKKGSTTGPDGGGAIVGTWNVVNIVIGWLLTTNSNQVATNIFDIAGQINISGAYTVTLNSMWMDDSTNPPSFTIYSITKDNQDYTLFLDGTTGEGMLRIFNLTTYNEQTFIGDVTFTYDGKTLTITQSTITDVDSDATVTISGTLSFNQTNIPANTPTLIQFSDYFYDGDENGSTTIEFKNDGTATVTDVYEGGIYTEHWAYITDGNQLIVTDEFGETMTYEYSVTGNTMTWILTDFIDVCSDSDYAIQTKCLADVEKEVNLTAGSLTNISITQEIVFSKAAEKQGLNVGRNYNFINPTKAILDYKLKN